MYDSAVAFGLLPRDPFPPWPPWPEPFRMRFAPVAVLALSLVACKGSAPADAPSPAPAASPAAAPASAPATAGPGAAATPASAMPARPPEQPKRTVSGKVLERIDLPSGMYLRLATSSGDLWAAVNTANVKKGDTVTVVNAITMDGFESTSLKRKFDRIVFGALEGTAALGEYVRRVR